MPRVSSLNFLHENRAKIAQRFAYVSKNCTKFRCFCVLPRFFIKGHMISKFHGYEIFISRFKLLKLNINETEKLKLDENQGIKCACLLQRYSKHFLKKCKTFLKNTNTTISLYYLILVNNQNNHIV